MKTSTALPEVTVRMLTARTRFAGRKLSNEEEKKASPFDVKLKKAEKPEERRKESLTDL